MTVKIGAALVAVVVFAFYFVSATADEEKAWFDLGNCDFCKNLMAEEGLMDHITKWEHHNTHNGSLTIAVVDKEYVPAFKRAGKNMEMVAERLKNGEQVNMCGMCMSYGNLMQQGAKLEEIDSDNVFITMMYAEDPAVIEQIHMHTDRTNDELAKMSEMQE